MDFAITEDLEDIRQAVSELCERFDGAYWRGLEPDRYPDEFVRALTEHGWLPAPHPPEVRGPRPSALGRLRDPRDDLGQRRQPRRLPRADVCHGHAPAARQRR